MISSFRFVLLVLILVCLMFRHSQAQKNQLLIDNFSLCNDSLRICYEAKDTLIFKECIALAIEDTLEEKPINIIIEKMAEHFIGVPYGSLMRRGAKQSTLVMGFEKFDCVTFVETILALSRCIKNQKNLFCDFAYELLTVRYRNGKIGTYSSRLHYFSDWIYDNESKKVVAEMSGVIDTIPYNKKICYMTGNKRKYKALKDKNIFAEIQNIEKQLSTRKRFYLPKDNFEKYKNAIKSGDIITFTTSTLWLDVSHTGLAIWVNDELYFIHASSQFHKVMISKVPLKNYLLAKKKDTGILVARPL